MKSGVGTGVWNVDSGAGRIGHVEGVLVSQRSVVFRLGRFAVMTQGRDLV